MSERACVLSVVEIFGIDSKPCRQAQGMPVPVPTVLPPPHSARAPAPVPSLLPLQSLSPNRPVVASVTIKKSMLPCLLVPGPGRQASHVGILLLEHVRSTAGHEGHQKNSLPRGRQASSSSSSSSES